MTTNANQNQATFFNLTARGVGYVSRVRKVDGGKGRNAYSYNALSVNALHGDGDAPEYTRFEFEAKSAQAKAVVEWLMSQDIKDRKVLMSFECGDLSPYSYSYQDKDYSAIKARLLKVLSLKINGEVIDINAIYHVEPSVTLLPAQQDAQPDLAQQRQAA